jgi:hypothetical protein
MDHLVRGSGLLCYIFPISELLVPYMYPLINSLVTTTFSFSGQGLLKIYHQQKQTEILGHAPLQIQSPVLLKTYWQHAPSDLHRFSCMYSSHHASPYLLTYFQCPCSIWSPFSPYHRHLSQRSHSAEARRKQIKTVPARIERTFHLLASQDLVC